MAKSIRNIHDLAVVATKAQATRYVKTGKYSDKAKYSTSIRRTHNKHIPGSKPFYTIYIWKK